MASGIQNKLLFYIQEAIYFFQGCDQGNEIMG